MKELVRLLQDLVAFKSTADNPEEIWRSIEYMDSLFDTRIFDKSILEKNGKYSLLVAFKGRDAFHPNVLLNGHVDVVPAEKERDYQMRVEGGIAYGRGTADMKGMTAVFILVMLELAKQRNLPDVGLLLNGDEEVGGEDGAGYAARELGLRPEFVLCGDGTHERREVVIKEKGGIWIELKTWGKSAHAAYPWKGENAIEKLMSDIEKIRAYVGVIEPEAWKSTCNVAVVETSNKTPNKVPSDARAVLDIRFTEALARTPEELVKSIKKLGLEAEVSLLSNVPLMVADEDGSVLQRFQQAAIKVLKAPLPLGFSHGASDTRYFVDLGISAFVFGARGANFHGSGEWVDVKSLEENRQILLEFLCDA